MSQRNDDEKKRKKKQQSQLEAFVFQMMEKSMKAALDAAMKAAEVRLKKLYTPPSQTNFGGAILSGSRSACQAACEAFARAVAEVAQRPRDE